MSQLFRLIFEFNANRLRYLEADETRNNERLDDNIIEMISFPSKNSGRTAEMIDIFLDRIRSETHFLQIFKLFNSLGYGIFDLRKEWTKNQFDSDQSNEIFNEEEKGYLMNSTFNFEMILYRIFQSNAIF